MARLRLTVNGAAREVEAGESTSLLSVLRDQLGLTGAKLGCGEGECGSCTVLVGGTPVRGCITTAASVGTKPVLTIEGLDVAGRLHPVQQAFLEKSAFQCGFCTPGMILEAVALIGRIPSLGEDDVRREMEGHYCRCGTYGRIVEAVLAAARSQRRG